jgi:hypothetical protein
MPMRFSLEELEVLRDCILIAIDEGDLDPETEREATDLLFEIRNYIFAEKVRRDDAKEAHRGTA